MPPLLPTYVLLGAVVLFAVGSLWVGIDRLDEVDRLAEARGTSAATMHDLQVLRGTVADIVDSAQRFSRTGDPADLDLFERARRSVPPVLTALRDRMRDDAFELKQIEILVPLIGKATALAASTIEHKRSGTDPSTPSEPGAAAKQTGDLIREIIDKLEARKQQQLDRDGRRLAVSINAARILRYLVAGVIMLLAALLFMAVRRLRSFMLPDLRADAANTVELARGTAGAAADGRVASLLGEALLRMRLAAQAQPAESAAGEQLRETVAAMERAQEEHARVEADVEPAHPEKDGVIAALARIAQSYARLEGITVNATIDQSVPELDHERSFLICRVAEWALEAMVLRKRTGEIALHFTNSGGDVTLRILALLDKPDVRLRLAPRETDEASVLQRAAEALGGRLVVSHAPTGVMTMLLLPVDR